MYIYKCSVMSAAPSLTLPVTYSDLCLEFYVSNRPTESHYPYVQPS